VGLCTLILYGWALLLHLGAVSAATGQPLVGYTEHSSFQFLDPMTNSVPWTCSSLVEANHCLANFSTGDVYIVNGLVPVDSGLDRTLGAALDGAPTEADGRPWTATSELTLNAGIATNSSFSWGPTAAGIAFDPAEVAPSATLNLSAEVDSTNVSWTGVGFASDANQAYWTSGELWAFLRSNGKLQVVAGGLQHSLYSSTVPAPGYQAGANEIEIEYAPSTNTVKVWLNGVAQSFPQSVLNSAGYTPQISHVGFQVHRQGGLLANQASVRDFVVQANGSDLFRDSFDNQERRIHYYGHVYAKSLNPTIGGPAFDYLQASFVAFTTPRTWAGMRGAGLRLENDKLRPKAGEGNPPAENREWTQGHSIYTRERGFLVTAANPGNGNNTTYGDGYLLAGTSWDGISNFQWTELLHFERDDNYRLLALFFLPVDGSCAAGQCEYQGVMSWLGHPESPNPNQFGTTPIRYRPCDSPGCSTAGEIDLPVHFQSSSSATWTTFSVPSSGGVNLGALGYRPERTIKGRTTGFTKATELGNTQYELWRDHKTAVPPGYNAWLPCAPNDPELVHNLGEWNAGQGAALQYRRYDPATGLSQDSGWITLTSPTRNIAPAGYSQWANWIIGRIDFGQENMLYIGNRDNHVCVRENDWDKGTGKGIVGFKLEPALDN